MVELHNVGTFNADTGFKAGYLNELEKMLEKALPRAMLKAKPNIESQIRCLKREWSVVYDMLNGQNNNSFGWDEHRQLVVAEDVVWESYVKSHKEASQFRHRSFPYYNQLTAIYARDRATGKDAQTAADVLEEIHAEDERTTDMNEERNTFYDCEADVSLDDMDVSGTDPRGDRDQGGSSSSNKRKKKFDARDNVYSSFDEAATLLGEKIQAVGDQISRSIASEVVVQQRSEEHQKMEEKASNLYSALWSIEGLTDDQRDFGLAKWLPNKWTHHAVIPIEGTFGYLALEYFMLGIVDEKIDVFAFGVLLLEIITGRRPVDSSKQSLLLWAKPLMESGNITELADPKLKGKYDEDEIHRTVLTACYCMRQSAVYKAKFSPGPNNSKF
ncbi:hypothetical protein GOBAR_DD16694 [Gossypium barbadense]|nr:hypothetical protein GOBAR_DD16694 [Gossypium barbadense]